MDFTTSDKQQVTPPLRAGQASDKRSDDLLGRLEHVRGILAGYGRVIVAFSGGVDSTLLAKLAREALGKPNVLAVTADSPSLARADFEWARRLAGELDLDHLVIQTEELSDAAYRANDGRRCYHCKRTLFVELEALARERGMPIVLYGAIADDLLEERPGQRAAQERGVQAPLQDAGLTKAQVRELAHHFELPNWDRPQNACLSSRVPRGRPVTAEVLRQVEQAESFLHHKGFQQVRVRHLGWKARIEVDREAVGRFADLTLRDETQRAFSAIGFSVVSVSAYQAGGADRAAQHEILLGNA